MVSDLVLDDRRCCFVFRGKTVAIRDDTNPFFLPSISIDFVGL